MNELQISKKKKEIEQAYDNKNVELLLDLSSNYIYANIGNFKEHLYIIEVFKKLIKYIDNNYLKYKHKLINILNHIGILSYYNSYYTIAINCYYLAMIQCDITKRANYYFNIALSLHSLNSFEKANVYYKKSISYANDDTIQYTLNYISCLIAQNDIKKANLLFEELKRSNKFEEQGYLNFSYTYIKLYLSLVTNNDFKLIKDEFYKQKEILSGNNSYHSLLTLNNLVIELTVIESLNDKKNYCLKI